MKKVIVLACAALAGAFAQGQGVEEGFVALFDGKTLAGWERHGGVSTYAVEDGAIAGRFNDPRRNTFLCTARPYGDFILRLEFKLEAGNSGVQFRSATRIEGDQSEKVFGYQAEIAGDAKVTARIFDEGRRGFKFGRTWLDNTAPEAIERSAAACKKGDWNRLEIQCVGPSIRTWLNDVPVVNFFDSESFSGFIGLQVHATKEPDGGVCARWRNIRIKELGTSQWTSFFVKGADGRHALKDARFVLPDNWTFNDAERVLVGKHRADEKRDGLVVSDKVYSDFIVRVSYQLFGGNSALYFRAEEVNTPWLLKGFQNEIAGDAKDSALWHTAGDKTPGRGWVATDDEFIAKVRNPKGWNTTCTVAYGDRLVELLNAQRTIDIIDPLCEKSGKVGLQLHGSADVEMWFKDFEILEITPAMKALIDR
ncbi:MAG: DUF1080 domain-containing protein [Verrucomicrobiota bacterium]|jgi:hypothetical protein|nr:DUF1080 domain-containing protein [Verrucomicrobiota bacterium]